MSFIDKLLDFFDPLSPFVKYGVAGLLVGVLFFIFKEIIRKNIFPTITKKHAYYIILSIILCSTAVCIIGLLKPIDNLEFNENVSKEKDSLNYQPLILEKKGIVLVDSINKKK